MIINNNIPALNTWRQMGINNGANQKSMEKLSSGLRINRAGDDAAGLSISEKMRAQIKGLNQAQRNSQDGISLIQTAEGALNETHSILQRMRELADQSANGTNTAEDRSAMQDEIKQLKDEIDRIGNTTEFNTQKLINGNLQSAGGASVGQDTTTGAIVGKLSSGKLTGTAAMTFTGTTFAAETFKIDGMDITVDWQNLTTEEQNVIKNAATDRKAAVELVVNKINEAIDAAGGKVEHISGYVDASNQLVLESGSKGTDSGVTLSAAGSSGVVSQLIDDGTTTGAATAGASLFNGTTVTAGTTMDMEINGVNMQIALTAAITNGTTTMDQAASILQAAITTAIDTYNGNTSFSTGDEGFIEAIKVNASKDGRLQIVSESGPVRLSNQTGTTSVSDLGLNSAQTDASGNGGMTFQIGANKGQQITFGISDMRSAALGISGLDVSTAAGASNALDKLDNAISSVSKERSKLGAVQNRLEHTISNLGTSAENLQAAESRIRDVDMAKEMMSFTKSNILSQASQSMLAQANQKPQAVLQLLG